MPLYNFSAQPKPLFRERVPHPPPKATILFVHGAWHGAWFWRRWQPLFAEHGYESYALDLPAHGTRRDDGWKWRAGIDDYVRSVRDAIEEIGDVILVGHSMGGFTVMKYLEQYDDVKQAVLLAPVPPAGEPPSTLVKLARLAPATFARFLLSMPVPPASEAWARQAFFSSDIDKATVRDTFQRCVPESARACIQLSLTMKAHPAKITAKTLVAHAADDVLVERAKMQELANALPDGELLVLERTAHDAALDTRWDEAGRAIVGWLDKVGAHTEPPVLVPPVNWKHVREPHLVPRPAPSFQPPPPPKPPLVRPLIHRPEHKP